MNDKSLSTSSLLRWSLVGMLFLVTGLVSCEQRQPAGEAPKQTQAAPVTSETASPPSEGAGQPGMPAAGGETALMAPESSPGRAANDEGVTHAEKGHWDVAEEHFRKALEADPKLGEAQFNLGLALDKLGKHAEATAAFKKAAELSPDNKKITESEILKKHVSG